ncbi:MAG: hypothetical protein IPN93_07235 [Bacteroidetes bacterium]|nr:hypothetical protein [Bacteroidota bacterium]MBK8672776.1 hypothetical protein [Bacteroidota bacterium]
MNKEKIIQGFKQHNGWLKSKDFNYQPPVYTILNDMIAAGEVQKVKNGLYQYLSLGNYNELENLAMLYPNAVLCLFSAWHYYELSTTIPFQHHLAFEHKANPQIRDYPPVKPYYWSQIQFELGIVQHQKIKMYDREKCVCDAVKFRNKVGEEITLEVLKNYMQSKTRNIEKLMLYAKQMRIEKIINPLLKSML